MNLASLYGARKVLMHALEAYGHRTGLEIVNSPWTAPAGPVRTPTVKYDARAGVWPILVVSIPLRVREASTRHPCGSGKGPVWVQLDMKNIEDFRAGPIRCLHWVPMESRELFDQTIRVQSCQIVRGPEPNVTTRTAPT